MATDGVGDATDDVGAELLGVIACCRRYEGERRIGCRKGSGYRGPDVGKGYAGSDGSGYP